jgi:corrinoid protein of di/trimethylamine methyltransferase
MMADVSELAHAIKKGDHKAAEAIAKEAMASNFDPEELVAKYMIPAMDEVGQKFECNEVFVPELLVAARAMKAAMAIIEPKLKDAGAKSAGKVVVGTVQGDLHDIGKNLVVSMLTGGGFEVVDLGVNITPDQFAAAVKENGAQVVAMSALLTTTMPAMKTTIEALVSAGLRDQVKVLVGGAPITQDFADEIGADGYSESANGAVRLARQMVAA